MSPKIKSSLGRKSHAAIANEKQRLFKRGEQRQLRLKCNKTRIVERDKRESKSKSERERERARA